MLKETAVMEEPNKLRGQKDKVQGRKKSSAEVKKIDEKLANLDWKDTGSSYAWPKATAGYRFVIVRNVT